MVLDAYLMRDTSECCCRGGIPVISRHDTQALVQLAQCLHRENIEASHFLVKEKYVIANRIPGDSWRLNWLGINTSRALLADPRA